MSPLAIQTNSSPEISIIQEDGSISDNYAIAAFYVAFLDNAPMFDGFNYWQERLDTEGTTLYDISSDFSLGPVFFERYADLGNAAFVQSIYENALGSSGSTNDIQYWVTKLDEGLSRSAMVTDLLIGALTIDLTSLLEAGELSSSEFAAATQRQNFITNKSFVALEYVKNLGEQSNIFDEEYFTWENLQKDPAYMASVNILTGVNDQYASVEKALKLISEAMESNTHPVGYINEQVESGWFLKQHLNGTVQDGYITHAKLYIDSNNNNLADDDEFTGIKTDENGQYIFTTELQGSLIAVGGINTDTDVPNTLSLTAPQGAAIISPVTTLIDSLIDHQGLTLTAAHVQITTAFGIDPNLDLLHFDPLAMEADTIQALTVQKLNAQLAVLATHSDAHSFMPNLAAYLIETDSAVDLTDAAVIEAITDDASRSTEEFSSINANIEHSGSLDEISTIQRKGLITESYGVAAIYSAVFNRAPDLDGLNYWESAFEENEETLHYISEGFTQHPVFTELYGDLENKTFVETLYSNVLGAEGDSVGIHYWETELEQGLSRADMLADFITGALTVDLSAMFEAGQLSQSELEVATQRQNLITNKSFVGLEFANTLGELSNLDTSTLTITWEGLIADPVYKASENILKGVNDQYESVEQALTLLDEAMDQPNPVNYINEQVQVDLLLI